jgi:hypothetical protein
LRPRRTRRRPVRLTSSATPRALRRLSRQDRIDELTRRATLLRTPEKGGTNRRREGTRTSGGLQRCNRSIATERCNRNDAGRNVRFGIGSLRMQPRTITGRILGLRTQRRQRTPVTQRSGWLRSESAITLAVTCVRRMGGMPVKRFAPNTRSSLPLVHAAIPARFAAAPRSAVTVEPTFYLSRPAKTPISSWLITFIIQDRAARSRPTAVSKHTAIHDATTGEKPPLCGKTGEASYARAHSSQSGLRLRRRVRVGRGAGRPFASISTVIAANSANDTWIRAV